MRTIVMCLLLSFVSIAPAFADGECPERPANQQERAAFQSVYQAAKAAVPSAPTDWEMKDETDAARGEAVPNCSEGPKDRPIHYWMKFKYNYSREAATRVQQNVVNDALKGSPEQQAKLAELNRKIEVLEGAKKEARKNRDRAEKDRVRDELKTLRRERNAIEDEINNAYTQRAISGQMNAEIVKSMPSRRDAELVVKVNERHAWVPKECTPTSVAGASAAYWCGGKDNNGRIVILLGMWDGGFKSSLVKTPVVTKAQNMVIEISGERQMAESFAKQLKLDLLKKQL